MEKLPGRGGLAFVSSQRPIASGGRVISRSTENCAGSVSCASSRITIGSSWRMRRGGSRGWGAGCARVWGEFVGERDLVGVGNNAALEPKIAVIPLHLRRDANGRLVHPPAQ